MMINHIPTPNFIDKHLTDSTLLTELDRILHPGMDGVIFHKYSEHFLNKLSKYKIDTYGQLKDEVNSINKKSSTLPKSIRDIVMGHYNYYTSEINRYKDLYNSLSKENKEKISSHDYFVFKDDASGIEVSSS